MNPGASAARLFAYGTLMFDAIFEHVTGCQSTMQPAELSGFVRLRVRAENYPGLVARPGTATSGYLSGPLTATVWQRLDEFESDFYRRHPVTVRCEQGQLPALTYIVREKYADQLLNQPWSAERFARDHLHHYLPTAK